MRSWGIWNWVTIFINWDNFSVWCVSNHISKILHGYLESRDFCLICVITLNNWSFDQIIIFLVSLPISSVLTIFYYFLSYIVNRHRSSPLIMLNIISWSGTTSTFIVNSGSDIFFIFTWTDILIWMVWIYWAHSVNHVNDNIMVTFSNIFWNIDILTWNQLVTLVFQIFNRWIWIIVNWSPDVLSTRLITNIRDSGVIGIIIVGDSY